MRRLESDPDSSTSAPDTDPKKPSSPPASSIIARLFERYAPAVRAYLLRRLGNIDEARDAAQEVFLDLWRQEQKGLLQEDAQAYLFTAAHNRANDCRRRARARVVDKHEPLEEAEIVADEPRPEEIVHWRRGLELIAESLKELPVETQRIFELYHGSRMTYTEIAKELGITSRTVERHMAQAIAHCRKSLKAYL